MVTLNKYSRKQKLWTNPDSLKLRSKLNGYNWFIDHKSNSNYAEIKIAEKQIKSANMYTFDKMIDLVEEKYVKSN